MNPAREQAEMLRAAIVLAVADGVITSSERGLLSALAKRIGVSAETLDGMVARALADVAVREELFRVATADPELTLELLVAAAQIDGQVHAQERQTLVQMAEKLDVPVAQFDDIFTRGIARADAIRANRRP
ncbi:MAG TPA: hypothetical protein P5572_20310 [Phycisphaerae bacterium]|nr:hypothetical protein [Phycisphaerales bacterium]HRX87377.1 hypothetical protein [Phycisphaerae bacterium]